MSESDSLSQRVDRPTSDNVVDANIDDVLEEHNAEGGVRVDLCRRHGMDKDIPVLKIYGTRQDKSRGFSGEVTSNVRKVKVAEMPENVSFEVLKGLAEYHGYKLEGK